MAFKGIPHCCVVHLNCRLLLGNKGLYNVRRLAFILSDQDVISHESYDV